MVHGGYTDGISREKNYKKRGLNSLLRFGKQDPPTEDTGVHARTEENVTTVDELVGLLSQKDLTKGCILPVNSSVTRSTRDSQNFCDELTLRK